MCFQASGKSVWNRSLRNSSGWDGSCETGTPILGESNPDGRSLWTPQRFDQFPVSLSPPPKATSMCFWKSHQMQTTVVAHRLVIEPFSHEVWTDASYTSVRSRRDFPFRMHPPALAACAVRRDGRSHDAHE